MAPELGLRERKKQRTRQQIADAAWSLIVERGFEQVTVAEIARAADVSEATVFNYFPAKEDLVFHALEDFEAEMLDAVRHRPAGCGVLDAFADFVFDVRGYLASDAPEDASAMRSVARVISQSPSLQARERQIYDRYTSALAGVIAAEGEAEADDLGSWVVANALVGLQRSVVDYVRRALLSGTDLSSIRTAVRGQGRKALVALRQGLGDAGSQGVPVA